VLGATGRVLGMDTGSRKLLADDGLEPAAVMGALWEDIAAAAGSWVTSRIEHVDTADAGALGLAHITARPAPMATERLATQLGAEGYLHAAIECLDAGVLAFDATLQPVIMNAALRRMHGQRVTTADQAWPPKSEVVTPEGEELPLRGRLVARTLEEGAVRGARVAVRDSVTGRLRQVSVNTQTVVAADGGFGGLVFAVHDIDDMLTAQAALKRQAEYDELTGVLNRRGFQARIDRLTADFFAPGGGVIVCDVDHFKKINDTLGHDAGDDRLVTVASILSAAAGPEAVVARTGGDEFAILGASDLVSIVEGATGRLAGEAARGPHPLRLTFGIASPASASDTVAELLTRADQDMYRQRRARRGTG